MKMIQRINSVGGNFYRRYNLKKNKQGHLFYNGQRKTYVRYI